MWVTPVNAYFWSVNIAPKCSIYWKYCKMKWKVNRSENRIIQSQKAAKYTIHVPLIEYWRHFYWNFYAGFWCLQKRILQKWFHRAFDKLYASKRPRLLFLYWLTKCYFQQRKFHQIYGRIKADFTNETSKVLTKIDTCRCCIDAIFIAQNLTFEVTSTKSGTYVNWKNIKHLRCWIICW